LLHQWASYALPDHFAACSSRATGDYEPQHRTLQIKFLPDTILGQIWWRA